MAGIRIPFLADVRDFLRGTKSVSDGLDDVADSLDDVQRDAARAGDEIGDELKDGAREGERSADRLEKKFRDAFDTVEDKSRKAGRDLGDNVRDGTRDAERAVEGFKDEARQNFAETASSFDGSMDSIADMAQSTLGGLATAIPGAGIALAGLGAAAGVFYQQWKDNAEAVKERIGEMYDDMSASGEEFLSEEYVRSELRKIFLGTEDAVISQRELRDAVRLTGLTQETVALAFAGDAQAQQELLAGIKRGQDDVNAAMEAAGYPPGTANSSLGFLNGLEKSLQGQIRAQETANQALRDTESAARQGLQGAKRQFEAAIPGFVVPPVSIKAQASGWQAEVDRAARSLIPPSVAIKPFVQKAV